MAQGRLQRTTQHYRNQLLQHEKAAEQALDTAYKHTLAAIQPQLDKLYHEIKQAQQHGGEIPLSWLYEQRRLETLKQYITYNIDHYAALSNMTVTQLQHNAVLLGQQAAQAQLKATVPAGFSYSFGVPSPDAIANLVGATQKGSPLADLFNGFGTEAADKASNALITGLSLGQNPRQIAGLVQQALGISRNRALVISRQEMIRAYRSSQLDNYQANSDVVSGWVWLDSAGSCAICSFMAGTEHSLDEEMQSHICCRCTMAPITRPWSDILSPLGIDTSDIEDANIDVSGGEDWFAQQDEATQREKLGSKAAYDLYASGQATLQDFVGVSYSADWGTSLYQKSVKQIMAEKGK